jgi:energy-converting hydrogenase Eha subunit A
MKRLLHHVVVPAIIPAAFFLVAATPVEVLGCRTRGLLAILIALLGALAGLGAVLTALVKRLRGTPDTHWWIATAGMLTIPAIAVILVAG